MGGPFLEFGEVKSGFVAVRDNVCVLIYFDDEASFNVHLFIFRCMATFVVDFLVKIFDRVGEERLILEVTRLRSRLSCGSTMVEFGVTFIV